MSKLDDLIARLRQEERVYLGDVRERQKQLEAAERRLEIHQAKLQALLQAKQLTEAEPPKRNGATTKKRTRALSGHWKEIMRRVHALEIIGGDFGYEDLGEAAIAIGHLVGRDTLRSQMSLYKGAGFVESTDGGRFRLTDYGRKAAGIEDPIEPSARNENEAPTGDAGGASETRDWSVRTTPTAPTNPFPWRRA